MKEPPKVDTWKMFDAISSTYDTTNRVISFGMDRGWRKKLARHVPKSKLLKVLDLATGTGDQLFSLFEEDLPIEKACGIDMAEEMLALAKTKGEQKPYKDKIEWLKADAAALPFAPESFDVATFSFGIRNLSNPLRGLQEIHRILRPEGRCLILEFSLPPQPIRPFYLLYLRHILPWLGAKVSKAPAAYRYLNQTIETFPYGKTFCQMMQGAGFSCAIPYRMAFGAVTLYVGAK